MKSFFRSKPKWLVALVLIIAVAIPSTAIALTAADFFQEAASWSYQNCRTVSTTNRMNNTVCYLLMQQADNQHRWVSQNSNNNSQQQTIDSLSSDVNHLKNIQPVDFGFFTNFTSTVGIYYTSPVFDANNYTNIAFSIGCSGITADNYVIESSIDSITWIKQNTGEAICGNILTQATTFTGLTTGRYYRVTISQQSGGAGITTANARFSN